MYTEANPSKQLLSAALMSGWWNTAGFVVFSHVLCRYKVQFGRIAVAKCFSNITITFTLD